MQAQKEGIFKRNTSPFSSPDSESSFVNEKDEIQSKIESSLEDSSEESSASSLKKRLRNLPSPSENSPFCEHSTVISTRLFQKERDFFYHLQELSNSIEEKDEAEINSTISENLISPVIGSKLQNPRARRRAKILEASKNKNIRYITKHSTDSESESVPKSSRDSALKLMIPKIESQEDSEFSQNSSRYEDSSEEKLKFNQIDFPDRKKNQLESKSGYSSNCSNLGSSEERKRYLYRSDSQPQTDVTSSHSSSSQLNFVGTFPILSNNTKISKKIGGYRPASILLRNLSSGSESDTGNDKILQNLMLERLKVKDDSVKFQSKVPIRTDKKSSIEVKEAFLKSPKKNVDDFEDTLQNQKLKKILFKEPGTTFSTPRKKIESNFNKNFFSTPNSDRSDSSERFGSKIPLLEFSRRNKNIRSNSQNSVESAKSEKSETDLLRENSKFQDYKEKTSTPEKKFWNLSLSIDSKEKNQSSLDDLVNALSDVSLKRENISDNSEKYSGNRKIQSLKSSDFKNCLTHSPVLEKKVWNSGRKFQLKKSDFESIDDFRHKSVSSFDKITPASDDSEKNSGNRKFQNWKSSDFKNCLTHSPVLEKKVWNSGRKFQLKNSDFESIDNFKHKSVSSFDKITPEIETETRHDSSNSFEISCFNNDHKTQTNILTSRSEYLEVKSSEENRCIRSFDQKISKKDELFSTLNKEEFYKGNKLSLESISKLENIGEFITEITDQKEIFKIENFSDNNYNINKKYDSLRIHTKSEDSGNKFDEILRNFSSEFSSNENNNQNFSSSSKIDSISVIESQNSESPLILKEKFTEDSNFKENFTKINSDESFSDSMEENFDLIQHKSELKPVQNQSEKKIISNDSMFESCIGDSNQQDKKKWSFYDDNERKINPDMAEFYYQKSKKEENFSLNLIESSAFFNSMKIAKSDSTAILSKKLSEQPNLSTKSSSSMSKLTCLLNSMKKDTQDRFPFTISENINRNSSKFKVENDQEHKKETFPEIEDETEKISYKLALSETKLLPSELINCISYENSSESRNFLPKMKGYVRKLSTHFKIKKRSNNTKSNLAKILFKNSECHLESVQTSEETMELEFLDDEIDSKIFLKKTPRPEENSKIGFDSETESGQFRSNRVKSSPVDIKNRRPGFSQIEDLESEDFQDIPLENKVKEIEMIPSVEEDLSSVDVIKIEVEELPSQSSKVDSSCFCFKMCRTLVQPSITSPESVYLSSTRPKPSKRIKP